MNCTYLDHLLDWLFYDVQPLAAPVRRSADVRRQPQTRARSWPVSPRARRRWRAER